MSMSESESLARDEWPPGSKQATACWIHTATCN
eukprot:COSAG05_NODE_5852_length_1073_cov_0.883984_2_plen_32_part_01